MSKKWKKILKKIKKPALIAGGVLAVAATAGALSAAIPGILGGGVLSGRGGATKTDSAGGVDMTGFGSGLGAGSPGSSVPLSAPAASAGYPAGDFGPGAGSPGGLPSWAIPAAIAGGVILLVAVAMRRPRAA